MSFLSSPTKHVARKPHRCDWCGERIEPGQQYSRYFWTDGGDAGSTKMHPECLVASLAEADEWGPGFEFTPWSNERPSAEAIAALEAA